MYLKYYQHCTRHELEILPVLLRICTRNTTDTILDMYLKDYQQYNRYVPEVLVTVHWICT